MLRAKSTPHKRFVATVSEPSVLVKRDCWAERQKLLHSRLQESGNGSRVLGVATATEANDGLLQPGDPDRSGQRRHRGAAGCRRLRRRRKPYAGKPAPS